MRAAVSDGITKLNDTLVRGQQHCQHKIASLYISKCRLTAICNCTRTLPRSPCRHNWVASFANSSNINSSTIKRLQWLDGTRSGTMLMVQANGSSCWCWNSLPDPAVTRPAGNARNEKYTCKQGLCRHYKPADVQCSGPAKLTYNSAGWSVHLPDCQCQQQRTDSTRDILALLQFAAELLLLGCRT